MGIDGSAQGRDAPTAAHRSLQGQSLPLQYGQHPLHDSSQRPLKIIIVGAGPSGIAALIALKDLPHISVLCFEKNSDVGGTWFETRYPGAACDVSSHAYQYTADSKRDWTRQ